MSNAQQIANSFVTEFFERLAKNPADLAELYGQQSSLTINDFEMGTTEAHDAEVPAAIQQWSTIVADSQLQVESVNAAPLYGGVNVFVTLTATGAQQQYFQIATTLEGYASSFGMEGYYVRHQIVSRIGALPVQPPPPQPEPVKAEAPVVPEPPVEKAPEPAAEASKKKAKRAEADEPRRAATPVPAPAPAEDAPAEAAPAAAAEEPATTAAGPAKPKSWASLASAAKGGISTAAPIRVVGSHEAKKKEEEAAAAAAAAAKAPASGAAAPREPRREKRVAERVGDRLMFNVDFAVSDDEIKTFLGPVSASLVSLRNNSERGHVFMDFAFGVAAYEELRKINPELGANKTKIVIHRQREREQRPRE